MILALSVVALILSALPALMFLANRPLFCVDLSPEATDELLPEKDSVSILIPARDEAAGIADCVNSVLSSERVAVEVVVLDDDSSDDTAEIVRQISASDSRVRLLHGKPLPGGWNGKQHACWQLSTEARYDRFLFLDADVRLSQHAIHSLVCYQRSTGVGLLSAFPHQETGTWLEKWLIPMMHFILLGYLPFSRMRSLNDAGLAAGCGQLFLTTRQSYEQAGTHQAIMGSRHDGVKLPRAYRRAGEMTDVVDGTGLASCRMYRSTSEVVRGVLKNADEGIASPRLIVVFTILLAGCSLLPLCSLIVAIRQPAPMAVAISVAALVLAHLPRFIAAKQFRQSAFGAFCHIPATMAFLALQWIALINHVSGRQIAWRGRTEK